MHTKTMTRLAEGELMSRCGDSPSQLAASPTAGKPPPKVLPAMASAHKRLMISWKRYRIAESTKPTPLTSQMSK